MRKLFFTLLISVLFLPKVVYANTFYTEYGSWIENDKEVETNELQVGKVEWKHKFYQELEEYTKDYYLIGENPQEYPYQSNNQIKTNYTDWQEEIPLEKEGRVIESKEVFPYQELKKISSLVLYDVDGSSDKLSLTEIEVTYQNQKIPITLECEDCSEVLINKLTDERYSDHPSFIEKDKIVTINLDQEYSPKDLIVNIYISDLERTKPVKFKIKSNLDDETEYINVSRSYYSGSSLGGYYQDKIKLQNYIKEPQWGDTKISDTTIEKDKFLNLLEPITYYRYQDTKYLYYKKYYDYLDGYYLEQSGYIKDENQKIPIYYKSTRDKIIIKDNITITKNYLDVDDIISYSSIPIGNLTIRNNIDFTKSGVYQVSVLYKDLNITNNINYVLEESIKQIDQKEQIKEKVNTNINKNQSTKIVSFSNKEEKDKSKFNILDYFKIKNITLFVLFIIGILLIVYSLNKIVERKK